MKRIYLNLVIALRSLYHFKLRSALAVLGVFLGTVSLIVVSNFSGSLAQQTREEISRLGDNLLIVRSGIVRRFGPRTRFMSEAANLTLQDAGAIAAGATSVEAVSPSMSATFPVRYGNVVLSDVLVVGADPAFSRIRNFRAAEGRFISHDDQRNIRKGVVLGNAIARKLFDDDIPLGKEILIRRAPCRVIGIMEAKGVDLSGTDQDSQIFMPLTTFMRRFVNKDYIHTIYVKVVTENALASAKSQIESILRRRHRILSSEDDDFTVIDMKDVTALKTQAMEMITLLGRTSAVISFLIGGIGILSIMILIVNERRVEIGIRRAVGSRKRDIVVQFLLESSFVAFSGGTVGAICGIAISLLIFIVSGLPFNISPSGLLLSFIASVVVGILAGLYPSYKATRIQPVDIIRS
jgi:putative ABC transport system permease protein